MTRVCTITLFSLLVLCTLLIGKPKVERWSPAHLAYCCVMGFLAHELYVQNQISLLAAAILVERLLFILFLGPPDQWLLTVIFTEPIVFAAAFISVVAAFSYLGSQHKLEIKP